MIYIVTGTPATGKTTFAKEFCKNNNCTYIDGKLIIKNNGLENEYDDENNCWIIDENKFAKICAQEIKLAKENNKSIIIDSHLSQFINPKLVDKCFVTTCDLKILNERLKKRKYSSKKIKDNLDAEIFKECEIEAKELGHNVEIVQV